MNCDYRSKLICQIASEHFSHSDWQRAVQAQALEFINAKKVAISDFMPESLLLSATFCVRSATPEEFGTNRRPNRLFRLLTIECESLEYKSEDIIGAYGTDAQEISDEEKIAFYVDTHLRDFCVSYLSLISIATFGCFDPVDLSSPNDPYSRLESQQLVTLRDLNYHISDDVDSIIEIPDTIDQFLDWSKKCNGIWSGSAQTNVEKAFGFLLNSVHHDEGRSEISRLAWGVAALEALAADSNQEIRGKIIRRIPHLFDCFSIKAPRKFLGSAYDFRSRLFHGDLPIYNKVSYPDGPPFNDISDVDAKCYKYGMVICAILIAVIWKCVNEGSYEVKFIETVQFK